jgi:hypothetical protein
MNGLADDVMLTSLDNDCCAQLYFYLMKMGLTEKQKKLSPAIFLLPDCGQFTAPKYRSPTSHPYTD